MLNTFLVILAFGALVGFQVPGLIKKKQWRELVTFAILTSIAFVFALLSALGVRIFY